MPTILLGNHIAQLCQTFEHLSILIFYLETSADIYVPLNSNICNEYCAVHETRTVKVPALDFPRNRAWMTDFGENQFLGIFTVRASMPVLH